MSRALKLLVEIKVVLRRLRAQRCRPRETYTDATIVLVYYWSVLNNQTRVWACDASNWQLKLPPGGLPSESRFSRRLRSADVQALLDKVERTVMALDPPPRDRVAVLAIDGRPLPVGNHSHDRDSGFGRAAGGKARGYKLHAIVDIEGRNVDWRLAPMNVDEREMGRRMIRGLELSGYLLADKNYDSNKLYDVAASTNATLVVPRRYGSEKGLGKHRHSPARLRSRDLLENDQSEFGRQLHARRPFIERKFGGDASTPELLNGLPAWVRRRTRVYRWVQAKLVAAELHRLMLARNRAA